MKEFYSESKVTVEEWSALESQMPTIMGWTTDQWRNRQSGRTKITQAERLGMIKAVEDYRKQHKTQK